MVLRKCLSPFVVFFHWLATSFTDIVIILRKNLRVRRRRYMAFLMEMFTPILVVSLLTRANNHRALLRLKSWEQIKEIVESAANKNETYSVDSFFSVGGNYEEQKLRQFSLCNLEADAAHRFCIIGYVADPATKAAVFDNPKLKAYFNAKAMFVEFDSEERLEACLKEGNDCAELISLPFTEASYPQGGNEDLILGFRGAVVFQSSITDSEIKYKIRLLEKHYGSLRHVLKTGDMFPSIYDRREYSDSYSETGFLSLQFIIEKLLIIHVRDSIIQSSSPSPAADAAALLVFEDEKPTGGTQTLLQQTGQEECPCKLKMLEISHRQSDQFHDPEDPLNLSKDYEQEDADEDDDLDFVNRGDEVYDTNQIAQVAMQSLVVSTILVLSFTFIIPSEQRRIASEKENGLTILLLVTGMSHRMQWVGNLISNSLTYSFPITVAVVLLTYRFNPYEGAVFEFASWSILWLLFFLYVTAIAAAGYLVTVFFHQPMLAITASISIWVTSFIAPVYHIDYYCDLVPVWVILLGCLHPSIALQMGLRLLMRFEKHLIRTSMFQMTDHIPTDQLRLVYIVIMLIVDSILYIVLTIYFDRVIKSNYGVQKPWYYICSPKEYVLSSHYKVEPERMMETSLDEVPPGHEPPNLEKGEPTIITHKIAKKYGKVVALQELSIQLHSGEIFVLLGHNGAGKSTMLNLFSGFTPATSGTAYICGYDMKKHMTHIQTFTGMCPQYSWLYNDLTPYEHLMIFGRLRGLKGTEAEEEAIELMEKLRIHEMAHWTVRNMSKGDKRKVSLAIALIAKPKIVILDEPTGGLDYYSRRAVWDLLLKMRTTSTIIFSTHFMDEAELLGDRIGILVSGKMEVCGSSAFLRQHFGLGYSLKIRMDKEHRKKSDKEEIVSVIRESMPDATMITLPVSPNGSRMCACNLPEEGYSSSSMSKLFSDLARLKGQLGIVAFSVSYTTVEEIFLELMRRCHPNAEEITQVENVDEYTVDEEAREEIIKGMFNHKIKCMISIIQFLELLKKRAFNTWRNKKVFFFQIVIPSMIYLAGIFRLNSHVILHGREGPALELKLENFPGVITLYHSIEDSFIKPEQLKAAVGPTGVSTPRSDLSLDYIHLNYQVLRKKHFVGVSVEAGSKQIMNVHFSPYVLHSSPIALNLFGNTLMNYLDNTKRITVTNHPLQHPYFKGARYEEDLYAPHLYALTSTLSGTVTMAFCLGFPLDERLNGVKHLQIMAGVSSVVYWLSNFVWDLLLITGEIAAMYLTTSAYPSILVFIHESLQDNFDVALGLLFVMNKYCGIMLVYTITHFAHSKSGAFTLIMTMLLLFGVIFPFFVYGIGHANTRLDNDYSWILLLIPPFALASAQRKVALTMLGNGRCNHFTTVGEEWYCGKEYPEGVLDPRKKSCCRNCPDMRGSEYCYDRTELTRLPWEQEYNSNVEKVAIENSATPMKDKDFSWYLTSRGIFYELLCLFMMGILFNILTVFIDSDTWKSVFSCIHGERGKAFQTNVEDEDVLDEMDQVERMVDRKKTDQEAIVAHNLCKTYGIYPALHNVSFTVHPGETFGIIGVNGAGKSTLFSLLTAESIQTYGNIYSVDCNLNSKRTMLMRKMGYVPHHGSALFDYMTSTETLLFFGRLRGLNLSEAKETSEKLLKRMELNDCKDKLVYFLSGGTKRRLATVVAIIAEPPV